MITFTAGTGHKKSRWGMDQQEEAKDIISTCLKIKNYCAKHDIFYLKLDIDVPFKEMINEANALREQGYFVHHKPTRGNNWYTSTLFGLEWDTIGYWVQLKDGDARMRDYVHEDDIQGIINELKVNDNEKNEHLKWTKAADLCPITTNWLKNVLPNNGKYVRCRFMLLESKGYIVKHSDYGYIDKQSNKPITRNIFASLNIALSQPEDCYLRRSDTLEDVPFTDGSAFLFDNSVLHEAANFSKHPRLHFIVQGGDFCIERAKLYIRSFKKQHPNAIL